MKTCSLFKAAAAASAFAVMAGSGAMLAKSFNSTREMQEYLWGLALRYCSADMTMVLNQPDKAFEDAKVYLSTKEMSSSSTNGIRIFKHEKDDNLTFYVEEEDEEEEGIVFTDTFQGVKLCWILRCHQIDSTKLRCYDLTFPKKANEMVIASYLPFISREAASTRQRMKKTLKLFFVDEAEKWSSLNLNHPSTFQNLALDPQVKKFIIDDLDRFVEGTTWHRSYLLYGPTGTGKSSLVAAMAKYLKADVYGLNLTQVSSNSQLQTLLMETTNSSILLVEDVDCLTKVTFSGLLDFMEGGWSNCDEQKRIIVFTATNKEKDGSTLLRERRIDVHNIHMPYCTPDAFETLASNYLKITTHKLFNEIKESILEVEVSPAEVAEQLMRCGSVNNVLEGLVEFLAAKKVEKRKAQERLD